MNGSAPLRYSWDDFWRDLHATEVAVAVLIVTKLPGMDLQKLTWDDCKWGAVYMAVAALIAFLKSFLSNTQKPA